MEDTARPIENHDVVDKTSLARNNSEAWDNLYGVTDAYVWGTAPPPFVTHHMGELRRSLHPGDRLLDIAAGEGRSTSLLLETGAAVFSCDGSRNGLRKFSANLKQHVPRIQCDVSALPIADSAITGALLIDTIETLPSPEGALDEIHRILRPEGWLLCNIPGPDDGVASDDMAPVGEGCLYDARYYYRFYNEASARGLLEASGFSIESVDKCVWWETAHPAFREEKHLHISRVFLLRKG